jgi:hypothetical protein
MARIFVRKSLGKYSIGRLRRRLKNNIRMKYKEIGFNDQR